MKGFCKYTGLGLDCTRVRVMLSANISRRRGIDVDEFIRNGVQARLSYSAPCRWWGLLLVVAGLS